ncbi:hypothetical protein POX_f07464 [Penicillium oxalicum]|uniref:Uncharacterized protein n=1 Tax=Penicillium oxalicum (strain 114-2 / CGMCC 5302) TaxID=933388 RepID=S7ZDP7_PENO1|nr:hypothetical protein POX_f07464 [Penicillium oxalicum]EPS28379.1 hypothetical protein PDE_03325 [Penicillium oxalicum 114-2]KAI2787105.1 hypothetical protein POX_f07464 [Penicillium oxalicum]
MADGAERRREEAGGTGRERLGEAFHTMAVWLILGANGNQIQFGHGEFQDCSLVRRTGGVLTMYARSRRGRR